MLPHFLPKIIGDFIREEERVDSLHIVLQLDHRHIADSQDTAN